MIYSLTEEYYIHEDTFEDLYWKYHARRFVDLSMVEMDNVTQQKIMKTTINIWRKNHRPDVLFCFILL